MGAAFDQMLAIYHQRLAIYDQMLVILSVAKDLLLHFRRSDGNTFHACLLLIASRPDSKVDSGSLATAN